MKKKKMKKKMKMKKKKEKKKARSKPDLQLLLQCCSCYSCLSRSTLFARFACC